MHHHQTYFSRSNTDGSIHTTASALTCSFSNSSRVRTSNTSTLKLFLLLYSRSVFGNRVEPGRSGGFSVPGVAGVGTGGSTGDREDMDLRDRPDGLRGTVGESGDRAGDAGRLINVSIVGGIGVLDGRGPRSMGRTGNGFDGTNGGRSARSSRGVCGPERDPVLPVPVGTEGSSSPSISSISSIDGNACAKSAMLRCDNRGDDEAEDDGDGGPKLDAGTSACGDGDGIDALAAIGDPEPADDSADRFIDGEGMVGRDSRFVFATSVDDPAGDTSRESRFVVETANPAFCSERIRSAMLTPVVRAGASDSSSVLVLVLVSLDVRQALRKAI